MKSNSAIIGGEAYFNGKSYNNVPALYSNMCDMGDIDYTFAVWFKTSQDGTLVSKIPSISATGFDSKMKVIYIAGGKINVRLNTAGDTLLGSTTVTDDMWHHVALIVRQGSLSDM